MNMKKQQLILIGIVVLTALTSFSMKAQRLIDKNGKVHYGDSPPENVKLKTITGKVSSYSGVSVEPFVFDPNIISKRKKSKSPDGKTSTLTSCRRYHSLPR